MLNSFPDGEGLKRAQESCTDQLTFHISYFSFHIFFYLNVIFWGVQAYCCFYSVTHCYNGSIYGETHPVDYITHTPTPTLYLSTLASQYLPCPFQTRQHDNQPFSPLPPPSHLLLPLLLLICRMFCIGFEQTKFFKHSALLFRPYLIYPHLPLCTLSW